MKKDLKYLMLLLLGVALLGVSCSRKGVYMPRHRKAHRCNTCPTFSELAPATDNQTLPYNR
ncbi:MAG: hypothetical protein IJU81_01115 [Bacteroidales bacterium]|nr:hypothetical protein [Bacteroidales bacterium]